VSRRGDSSPSDAELGRQVRALVGKPNARVRDHGPVIAAAARELLDDPTLTANAVYRRLDGFRREDVLIAVRLLREPERPVPWPGYHPSDRGVDS
jgi:hypothetical protein